MGRRPVPTWDLDARLAQDLALHRELQPLIDLVASHCTFVDPRVARAVPVVFPKTARVTAGRSTQGSVRGGIRYWSNQPAEEAILDAMNEPQRRLGGYVVCHVYPGSPRDPRHFTNLQDLFLIPTTLSSLTEWGPVLAALKRRAFELYGYRGPAGKEPKRPTLRAPKWAPPARLDKAALRHVVARLRKLRRERPMYIQPRGEGPVAQARSGPPEVDFDRDLWSELAPGSPAGSHIRRLVALHTCFAPPAVVAAVPNPFPHMRRARDDSGERAGQVVGGDLLCTNMQARLAILVALDHSLKHTRGAVADHLWPDAARDPLHFAHIGGLVVVPAALSSVVDAAPIRAMLERHAFERTGYAGPRGVEPPAPPGMPAPWPQVLTLRPVQVARAIRRLRRHRAKSVAAWKARRRTEER